MHITIFAGPDPVSNLKELIRGTPLARGDACIVVPDRNVADTLERCLAVMSGNVCFGHRIYTFDDMARSIMSKGGSEPESIGNHVRRALVGELIRGRVASDSPFVDIATYDGFIDVLTSFIRDIRVTTVKRSWKTNPELSAIVRAYDFHLRMAGKTDAEGAVIGALADDAVERFAARFDGALILHGFYDFTDNQFELVERLCSGFKRTALTVPCDSERQELFLLPGVVMARLQKLGARIVDVPRESTGGAGAVMRGFMGGIYPDSGDAVEIHTFRSEASEADWIAGTIHKFLVDGAYSPADILVVSRDRFRYGGPLHGALRRHGIPVDKSVTRPLMSHPLIHLIFDAIDASVRYDNEELFRRVIESPYTVTTPETTDMPGDAADMRGWSCIITDQDTPDGYETSVRKMLDYLRVPETLDGGGESRYALQESLAYQRFLELLKDFVGVYTPFRRMMRAGEFAELLRRFVSQADMPDVPVYSNGVCVADADTARHISRKIVFMTGLTQDAFPRRHDQFRLHPRELSRIVTQRREQEEGLLFYLGGAGADRLYFTFPGIDDEGTESGMSPYLGEIRDGCSPWCVHEFHKGVPGSCWQGGAVGMRGKWELAARAIRRGHFTGDDDARSDDMAYILPDDIFATALIRYSDYISRDRLSITADGLTGMFMEQWGPDRVFSVTGLEGWVACPLDFYFRHVLKIRPEWIVEDEIDPAGMGSFIHGLLADFYRYVNDEQIDMAVVELSVLYDVGDLIIDRAMTRYGEISSDVHPVAAKIEMQRIRQWMKSFIACERERLLSDGFSPGYMEIPFGDARDGDSCPPLVIERDGGTVKIGGRIDRIDIREQGDLKQIRIVDYKTGSSFGLPKKTDMLQLPLYLKAALSLIEPGSTGADSYYYMLRTFETKSMFIKIRGGRTVEPDDPHINDAEERALAAARAIRERIFAGNAPQCTSFCSFRMVCAAARLGKDCLSYATE